MKTNNAIILAKSRKPSWNVNSNTKSEVYQLAQAIKSQALEKLTSSSSFGHRKILATIAEHNKLEILAELLLNRGISDAGSALRFLTPDLTWMHDWRQLPDINIAVSRLKLARERGEKVLIHGDYDADGTTATALLLTFLRQWGLVVSYYIPNRKEDGYGLSEDGIQEGYKWGARLLVTVDCGISNAAEVDFAAKLGMDVIITDHHLPPQALPKALAIVNPKRLDSSYPFSELAGVGLAWKLAMALEPEGPTSSACLQMAALGTVADLVPLMDENRVLVSLGLKEINNNAIPGIAALAAAAGCELGKLDSSHIAYSLGPRLNAAGRMDSADAAVDLLLEQDPEMAAQLAQGLHNENQRRRDVENEIFQEALAQAAEQAELQRRVLVLHGRDWHPGVVGIVASKILDRYYRPAIILCGDETLSGSARSIQGFDIHAALKAHSDQLIKFGGHPGAAGLSLSAETLESFRESIDIYAQKADIDSLLQPVLSLESSLAPEDINRELVKEIALLRPYGFGNPEPVFAIEGFSAGALELVGKDKNHLRLRLDGPVKGDNLWAIGFGKAAMTHNIDKGAPLRAAGSLQLNRWNGHTSVQLLLSDLKGPPRTELAGRLVFDRRKYGEPWLTHLAAEAGTVFFANTWWGAKRLLGERIKNCNVIILPPDKYREKVYNLKAESFCFLEPAWNLQQLRELIMLLPQGCDVHLFGAHIAPEEVLRPNLNLLRQFYKVWREQGHGTGLLSLLPADLAEPLLLERILVIFAEAGLAGNAEGQWQLVPVKDTVDLTSTQAWTLYSTQLDEYRNWLKGFSTKPLDQFLA